MYVVHCMVNNAVVACVQLRQPTHSLWGDTKHHNVRTFCIADTTAVLLYIQATYLRTAIGLVHIIGCMTLHCMHSHLHCDCK